MSINIYKKLVAKDQKTTIQKTLRQNVLDGNEFDMNSLREGLFFISKDVMNAYIITTHFKSKSRVLHYRNIFTGEKHDLEYHIEYKELIMSAKSAIKEVKARIKKTKEHNELLLKELEIAKLRKLDVISRNKLVGPNKSVFVKNHDLIKDTLLKKLILAKIRRNKAKTATPKILQRRAELKAGLKFVCDEIAKRNPKKIVKQKPKIKIKDKNPSSKKKHKSSKK